MCSVKIINTHDITIMEVNIIHATYPSDDLTGYKMKKCQEDGCDIHSLNVTVADDVSEPSIEDIYTTLVPMGCHVQCLSVRYVTKPERALVNISSILTIVDSVHLMSPIIPREETQRLKDILKSGIHFKLRMTGSMEDNSVDVPEKTPGSNYITVKKCEDTTIVISEPNMEKMSKPLDSSDEELVRLDEQESLMYISQNS